LNGPQLLKNSPVIGSALAHYPSKGGSDGMELAQSLLDGVLQIKWGCPTHQTQPMLVARNFLKAALPMA